MTAHKYPEESVFIDGAVGAIDARLVDVADTSTIMIVCHPHPQHGGTMTNKVVTTIARACQRQGIATIRFNFRGVGNSEGSYADGLGEVDDLAAVYHYVKSRYPSRKIAFSGFSFGAGISAAFAKREDPEFLISIAPPVSSDYWPDMASESHLFEKWFIVQGDKDEIATLDSMNKYWEQSLSKRPMYKVMQDSDHFFHGRLIELREVLESWIGDRS